jgi:hypothetical protein
MSTTLSTTVATKPNWAAGVSAVVGAVVSWLVTKWTSLDVGFVALFTLPLSYAYHWLINEGEKKFPWLSVFFLALPKNLPTPVTPTPSTFVETSNGVWAADVNAMEKAKEVAKTTPTVTQKKSTPKTKR